MSDHTEHRRMCPDCRWYCQPNQVIPFGRCVNPGAKDLTGAIPSLGLLRSSYMGACGPEGRLWEQKKPPPPASKQPLPWYLRWLEKRA